MNVRTPACHATRRAGDANEVLGDQKLAGRRVEATALARGAAWAGVAGVAGRVRMVHRGDEAGEDLPVIEIFDE